MFFFFFFASLFLSLLALSKKKRLLSLHTLSRVFSFNLPKFGKISN